MRTTRVLVGGGLVAAASWVVVDYRAWRALGVGGLPPTPAGWLTTTWLRLLGRDPLRVRDDGVGAPGRLPADLAARGGARPRVAPHPIPHRVLGEAPAPALRERLQRVFDEVVARDPERVEQRTSLWEKHNHAAFTRARVDGTGRDVEAREVGHVHPADASAHVTLHPADAQRVLDLGWGELHPLAGQRGLPTTYTMLYPPRTDADVDALATILAAAVDHHLAQG